jgi:hypothetical protein
MYSMNRVLNPEIYQGKYKKRKYFEGWYFKLTDRELVNAFAVIPGVAFGAVREDRHSFVQVLDANECKTYYVRYEMSDFKYHTDSFQIVIGNNFFSRDEIRLDLNNHQIELKGSLAFNNIVEFPKSILSPGIMGPFSYIPFMECHHGIVNIHHEIAGQLCMLGRDIDFTDGYGYIEKDWGSSFPEAWIWLQSNHFGNDDVTVMFSVAKIPWLGKFFMGFISFIRMRDEIFFFATYNRARITSIQYERGDLVIQLQGRNHKMRIEAWHSDGGTLKAPKKGLMEGEILESITAEVLVTLYDYVGNVLYEGKGTHAGLEISTDMINEYFDKK